MQLDFDAEFEGLSEFKPVLICSRYKGSIIRTCAKLQVQTQIMDQSVAIMLWQLCYGKISFIELVPVDALRRIRSRLPRPKNNNVKYYSRLCQNTTL